MKRAIVPSALAIALAGCAPPVDAPSLAMRPSEIARETAVSPSSELPTSEPIASAGTEIDISVRQRIDTAVKRAQDGKAEFEQALGIATGAVGKARGAAPASDSWIEAQLMVTRLERTREPVTSALAELDVIRRELEASGLGYTLAPLDRATAAITNINDRQQSALAALSDRLVSR